MGNRTNFSLNTEFITSQFNTLNQLDRSESSIYGGGNIISLSGILDDANIDTVFVNNHIATISGNTFTIDDLALDFGVNEITLEAADYAGNITQTSLNITLDSTASAVYDYDLDGNLISNSVRGTTWTYSWDSENRLIKAASSLGKNISYAYYEDGMLGFKKNLSSSDTRYYIYDGIHCIAEYDGSNGFIKEIIYGPQIDEVLCAIDDYSSAYYYHQDALQSVVAVTDGFRNKIATYGYDVYGKIKSNTGSLENEILYTGRWLDSDTGLYYYRARWYEPSTGRFISRDPIGIDGGINLYGYVGNGPVNKSDPKGLKGMYTAGCLKRYKICVAQAGIQLSKGLVNDCGVWGAKQYFVCSVSCGLICGVNKISCQICWKACTSSFAIAELICIKSYLEWYQSLLEGCQPILDNCCD